MKFLNYFRKITVSPRVRLLASASLIGLGIIATLGWRFWELPAGVSSSELSTLQTVLSAPVRSAEFIVFLPYNILLKIALQFSDNIETARVLSLTIAGSGLVTFYVLAREWWTRLVAASATVMMGTSYWFLVLGRLINPQVLSLAYISGLIFLFLRLKHESKWWQIIITGFAAGSAIYVPPLAGWLAIALTVMAVVHSVRVNRGRVATGWTVFFVSFAVALIPLAIVAAKDPSVLRATLGLEELRMFSELPASFFALSRTILWDGGAYSLLLPHIGLLDFASLIFVLLGMMRTAVTWKIQRSQLTIMLGALALAIALISAKNYAALGYLLPITYLLVARGLNQYLSEWRKRFPRNPSARLASIMVMFTLVGFVAVYNLRSYYVAWARNDSVREQFQPQELLK